VYLHSIEIFQYDRVDPAELQDIKTQLEAARLQAEEASKRAEEEAKRAAAESENVSHHFI
jgi:membrane protein involved in colicin uptake